jgi:hypothetical protein
MMLFRINIIEKYTMGRQKGTPKTGGRQKGTPNKTTAELKKYITDAFAELLPYLKADMMNMKPATRWALADKYLKYIMPTLNKSEDIDDDKKIEINITFGADNDASDDDIEDEFEDDKNDSYED